MEIAICCDIVRNNNPKSKRFGQHGIVLTTSTARAYVNYQDGFTAYCAVKHFILVKHFKPNERIGDESVYNRGYWGHLKLVDANDNVRTISREEMWTLAQKYIHRTAVVV